MNWGPLWIYSSWRHYSWKCFIMVPFSHIRGLFHKRYMPQSPLSPNWKNYIYRLIKHMFLTAKPSAVRQNRMSSIVPFLPFTRSPARKQAVLRMPYSKAPSRKLSTLVMKISSSWSGLGSTFTIRISACVRSLFTNLDMEVTYRSKTWEHVGQYRSFFN